MPKYLFEASYGTEGVRGVAQKGGSARREIVGELIASMGGRLESFFFAFDADVYATAELPGNEAATALRAEHQPVGGDQDQNGGVADTRAGRRGGEHGS